MTAVEDGVLKNLKVFVAFARSRLGDEHLAEDAVQESLIKALSADRQPETEEETTRWFYRILRRSIIDVYRKQGAQSAECALMREIPIIDVYRKQGAQSRALERLEKEVSETPDETDEGVLCQCFHRLLPLVPEQYRELLEEVDLKGADIGEVAAKIGVTRNNLTVRLHRARKHLRDALAQNCRACSTHGCLDCTCGDSSEPADCH